jgi:hypothetical protein
VFYESSSVHDLQSKALQEFDKLLFVFLAQQIKG